MESSAQKVEVQPSIEDQKKEIKQRADQAKNILLQTFINHYQTYSQFLNQLPFDAAFKHVILERLNESFLWAKEAFIVTDFTSMVPKNEVPVANDEIEQA